MGSNLGEIFASDKYSTNVNELRVGLYRTFLSDFCVWKDHPHILGEDDDDRYKLHVDSGVIWITIVNSW